MNKTKFVTSSGFSSKKEVKTESEQVVHFLFYKKEKQIFKFLSCGIQLTVIYPGLTYGDEKEIVCYCVNVIKIVL